MSDARSDFRNRAQIKNKDDLAVIVTIISDHKWTLSSLVIYHYVHGCYTLREKCSYSEFFLIRIFPHSDGIQRDTPYLSVFSPNLGKHGPENHRIRTLFTL